MLSPLSLSSPRKPITSLTPTVAKCTTAAKCSPPNPKRSSTPRSTPVRLPTTFSRQPTCSSFRRTRSIRLRLRSLRQEIPRHRQHEAAFARTHGQRRERLRLSAVQLPRLHHYARQTAHGTQAFREVRTEGENSTGFIRLLPSDRFRVPTVRSWLLRTPI